MSHITVRNFILPNNLTFVQTQYLVFLKINCLTFSPRYASSDAPTFYAKNNAPGTVSACGRHTQGHCFVYFINDKIPQKAPPEHMLLHGFLRLYIPRKEAVLLLGSSGSFLPPHSRRSSPDKFCGCVRCSQWSPEARPGLLRSTRRFSRGSPLSGRGRSRPRPDGQSY